MEDLLALVELFDLQVVSGTDNLNDFGGLPYINVIGSTGEPVTIRKNAKGKIHATGMIDGVPMRYFGNGSYLYSIDL